MVKIRSPICSVLGHVDHGKSSILDNIRGTAVVASEAGAITQAIGASLVPLDAIKKVSGKLLEALKMNFTIPGLLFVDTPGHAAFTSLRKRGGNLADIAILVVDINEGFKPQTIEALEILKSFKTPFIVAANKIDLIHGWKVKEGSLLKSIQSQQEPTITAIETKLYELVGKLHEFGFESERFDRVGDFTKQIAIVPCSAKTGDGIPELLMVITGLAQRFLEGCLECNIEGNAEGIIVEVKEEKGLGKTLDVIIYNGHLKVNDTIVIGGLNGPVVTKVRGLFEPEPMQDAKAKSTKFMPVKEVVAAIGVKIAAPEVEEVVAGMPLKSCSQNQLESVKEEIEQDVAEAIIETEEDGIIVKADTLGSLEALIHLFNEKNVPIRKATIGNISKKDITEAESNYAQDPSNAIIIGFNVTVGADVAVPEEVKIITSDIIYRLIEGYDEWITELKKRQELEKLESLTRPCKMQIMKGYVFRQSNPAVVGVDVLAGSITTNTSVMNSQGKDITSVKSIQHEKDSLKKVEAGKQVAMSFEGVTVGRQIHEDDILYSGLTEPEFRKLRDVKNLLSKQEIEVLKEIAEIKRKENPVWGI